MWTIYHLARGRDGVMPNIYVSQQQQQQQQEQQSNEPQRQRRSSMHRRLENIAELNRATETATRTWPGRVNSTVATIMLCIAVLVLAAVIIVVVVVWWPREEWRGGRVPATKRMEPVCASSVVSEALEAMDMVAEVEAAYDKMIDESNEAVNWKGAEQQPWLAEVDVWKRQIGGAVMAMAAPVKRVTEAMTGPGVTAKHEQMTSLGESALWAHCSRSGRFGYPDGTGTGTGIEHEHCRRQLRPVLDIARSHLNTKHDDVCSIAAQSWNLADLVTSINDALSIREAHLLERLRQLRAAAYAEAAGGWSSCWGLCKFDLPFISAPPFADQLLATEALFEHFSSTVHSPFLRLFVSCNQLFDALPALGPYGELLRENSLAIVDRERLSGDNYDPVDEGAVLLQNAHAKLLESALLPQGSCLAL
ncbi:hypothetical protein BC567DRAFT_268334 [Phyllosticta citribraziliensis]